MVVHSTLPDLDTLDVDALRAIVLRQHEQLLSRDYELEHLKLLIAKLQRMQFGRKSEKIAQQIEQLELKLEELQTERAAEEAPQPEEPATIPSGDASSNQAAPRTA
jgi:transposase